MAIRDPVWSASRTPSFPFQSPPITAPTTTPITSIMLKFSESISARTALKSALDNPLWADQDSIPVTNRNQKLVGVLRHQDFRKGLAQISNQIVQPRDSDPIAGIFEAYGSSLLILFATLSDIVSSKSRQRR